MDTLIRDFKEYLTVFGDRSSENDSSSDDSDDNPPRIECVTYKWERVNINTRSLQKLIPGYSDTLTNKKKKSALFEVQNSVKATSMVYRNVDEIKKKWDDVKRNTKKRAVSVRRDRNLTGGGESSVELLSSVEEAVVSLIAEKKIYGISEGLDCFQQQTAETTIIASVHQQPVSPVCHTVVQDRIAMKSPRPALSAPDEIQC
ncbi:NAIF1 [Mytilus coruscus]|uniref:NAIF1 n=1 Tax=Mytilus coruscus TaxID=42192 RepID=A0A6J8A2J3_MYTCO|nr:NAIF1 [Mytilus coruscus]